MKTKRKLSHKHFRYLTKKDLDNPLYALANFCRVEIRLSTYLTVINKLTKASCLHPPKKIKIRKASDLSFYCEFIAKNIELLYVLNQTFDKWKLQEPSPYYHLEYGTYCNCFLIADNSLFGGTTLYFKRLTKKEVKNIRIFTNKFFRFKSLREWYKLMEDLRSTIFDESSLSGFYAYENDDAKIFRYLEKLAEATFLIYEIKAKEHIFKHHVADFYLEKYLGEESTETSEEEVPEQETELVSEEKTLDIPHENPSAATDDDA